MSKRILTKNDTIKDSDIMDYENQILVMDGEALNDKYREAKFQLWFTYNGFGCSPTAIGRAVFAICLEDGTRSRWDRSDFLGIYNGELTYEQKDKISKEVLETIEAYNKRLISGSWTKEQCTAIQKEIERLQGLL
jgi:hypothetical protein